MHTLRLARAAMLAAAVFVLSVSPAVAQPAPNTPNFIPADYPFFGYIDAATLFQIPGMKEMVAASVDTSVMPPFDWTTMSNMSIGAKPTGPNEGDVLAIVQSTSSMAPVEQAMAAGGKLQPKQEGGMNYLANEHLTFLFSNDKMMLMAGDTTQSIANGIAASTSGNTILKAPGFQPGGGATNKLYGYGYCNIQAFPAEMIAKVRSEIATNMTGKLSPGIQDQQLVADMVNVADRATYATAADLSIGTSRTDETKFTFMMRVAFSTPQDATLAQTTWQKLMDLTIASNPIAKAQLEQAPILVTTEGPLLKFEQSGPIDILNRQLVVGVSYGMMYGQEAMKNTP